MVRGTSAAPRQSVTVESPRSIHHFGEAVDRSWQVRRWPGWLSKMAVDSEAVVNALVDVTAVER